MPNRTAQTHTPGPWTATNNTVHTVRPDGSLRIAIIDTEMTSAAIQSREESLNNARLIAAAPDLLEEAKKVADAVPHWVADGLRAAIAKAEGRE